MGGTASIVKLPHYSSSGAGDPSVKPSEARCNQTKVSSLLSGNDNKLTKNDSTSQTSSLLMKRFVEQRQARQNSISSNLGTPVPASAPVKRRSIVAVTLEQDGFSGKCYDIQSEDYSSMEMFSSWVLPRTVWSVRQSGRSSNGGSPSKILQYEADAISHIVEKNKCIDDTGSAHGSFSKRSAASSDDLSTNAPTPKSMDGSNKEPIKVFDHSTTSSDKMTIQKAHSSIISPTGIDTTFSPTFMSSKYSTLFNAEASLDVVDK
jgi:hypothetical protein